MVDGAGDVSRDAVERLGAAFEPLGRASVDKQRVRLAGAAADILEMRDELRTWSWHKSAAGRDSSPLRVGRPSCVHFAQPPSSTATASWPM